MEFELGFGTCTQKLNVPDENLICVLLPNPVSHELTGQQEVVRALQHPIGTPRLQQIVQPGEKIAIITSDVTRPLPSGQVLPSLLDELYAAGVSREDITVVFALGSHRKQTPDEMKKLVGERVFAELVVVPSQAFLFSHGGNHSRKYLI